MYTFNILTQFSEKNKMRISIYKPIIADTIFVINKYYVPPMCQES